MGRGGHYRPMPADFMEHCRESSEALKGYDDSWGGRNHIVIEKVTHRMPLPEPPKE